MCLVNGGRSLEMPPALEPSAYRVDAEVVYGTEGVEVGETEGKLTQCLEEMAFEGGAVSEEKLLKLGSLEGVEVTYGIDGFDG